MHIDTNYNLKIKMGEANTANAPHVRVCYSKVISKTGLDTNAQAYTPETISKATTTTSELEILPRVPLGQAYSRLKIHSIQVANRDTVTRTVFLYSEDEGGTEYYFVSGASVPAGATLWVAEDGSMGITPEGASGVLSVGSGGTGATSFTDGAFLIGNGTNAVQAVGPGTAGQLPVSQGAGADPIMRTLSGDATLSSAGALTLATYMNFGGRLTLTSGTAVTTSDVTGATTIYYTPYIHNRLPIYASGAWTLRTFTERSLALGTITSGRPYDVFIYDSSGTLTLEILSWTSDTARATALTTQDGVLVKSGDATRVYLGTFRTTSTTQTEDSKVKRFVWNMYNRVHRYLLGQNGDSGGDADTLGSLTGTTLASLGSAYEVAVVSGLAEDPLYLSGEIECSNSGAGNGLAGAIAKTSATAAVVMRAISSPVANYNVCIPMTWAEPPFLGYLNYLLSFAVSAGTGQVIIDRGGQFGETSSADPITTFLEGEWNA